MAPDTKASRAGIVAFALVAAALLPLLVTLFHDAVQLPLDSDGRFLTYQNAFVRDPHGVPALWTHDFFAGAETGSYEYLSGYYRPVTNTALWLEYRLAGTTDRDYNQHGVFVHWLNAVLLGWLVWKLAGHPVPALVAMALFAVHPINAMAVTQTKARADLVFATFYLAALVAYVSAWAKAEPRRRALGVGLSVLLFAGALLSKETGATLPAGLVLLHLLVLPRSGSGWRRDLAWTLPFWAVLGLYAVVRLAWLHIWPISDVAGYAARHSTLVILANVLKNPTIYLMRMFVPYGADYAELCPNLINFIDPTLRDPMIWLSAALLAGLAVAAVRVRATKPNVAFFLGVFLVSLAPLVAVRNTGGTLSPDVILAQERWAYLPSAAIMALLGLGVAALDRGAARRGWAWRLPAAGLTVAVLAFFASIAAVHAREADTPMALLKQYQLVPDEALGRRELANKLVLWAQLVDWPKQDFESAEQHCRQAVAAAPDSPVPAVALARVLALGGRWPEILALVTPWYPPEPAWLERQLKTNLRAMDDVNRMHESLAFLSGQALGRTGSGPRAMRALCDALRLGHDPEEVRKAATNTLAFSGAPGCRLAADPLRCREAAWPSAIAQVSPWVDPARCEHLSALVAEAPSTPP